MKLTLFIALICSLCLTWSCADAPQSQTADADQNTEIVVEKDAINNVSDIKEQDVKNALEQLGDMQDSEAELVSYQELKKKLPASFLGLPRIGELEGEDVNAMGFSYSEASAEYGEGEKIAELSFIDTRGISIITQSMASFSQLTSERQSDSGYEKTFVSSGFPTIVEHEKEGQITSVRVLVSDRFIISVDTEGVSDEEVIEQTGKIAKGLSSLAQ